MKLQEKTSLILVALLIVILALISIFVSVVSLSSYSALEHRYVLQDVDQAVNRLNDEYNSLSSIVTDWGPWDDTYAFVNGGKPDYVENNLLPEAYSNLRINIVVMTNRRGEIVYAGAYDLRNRTMIPVPATLVHLLTPGNPLLSTADPKATVTGILMIDGTPLIVASRPIIHSDFSGDPQGVVIMGRYLDPDEVALLAKLTKPSLRFLPIDDPSLPPSFLSELSSAHEQGTGVVTPLDKNLIAGYALISDVYGRDVLVLELEQPRDIYQQGVTSTIQYILIVLGAGLLFGVVILLILDRLVLSRVSSLSQQVHDIGKETLLSRRMSVEGSDEFSALSVEINRMLETIEKTHEGLQQSEARFRELAELLPQIIFEMDLDGGLMFVNHAGQEIFGIDDEAIMSGTNVGKYLIPEDYERMYRGLEQVIAGAKSPGEIYHLKRLDGSLMSAIVYTAPIHRNGTVTGFRGIVTDITERIILEEALIESQEYLQTLLWSVKAGIIVVDSETHTIVDANPAALEMIGTTKDQLVGRSCHRFICPAEEGACPITDLNLCVDDAERELLTADGRKISIIKYVVPVMLQDRACLLETFIDNTDRRKIEHDLRESTELLTGILQASPVGVFRLDASGNVLYVNEMFTKITGITQDRIKGTYWVSILHPDDQGQVLGALADAIQDRTMVKAETRFIHANGQVYWLLGHAVPLISPDGYLTGWVGTVNDITERKQIERALRESEEKYRALTENTADVLFSTDLEGRIHYISPQIGKFRFETPDLLNRNLLDLVFPDDRPKITSYLKKEIGSDRRQAILFRILDTSGTIRWMEANTTPKHGADGKVEGIYGILRDITDRKRDEDAIHLANKKLNLMNDITRHDILNTITGIFGLVDMAVASDNKRELEELLIQIKDVGRVIQRQITFTRDYQGVGVHAPVWQSVWDVVSRATQNFNGPGLSIVIDIEDTEIFADPLLEKVFYNLVDNALRYGERVTTIRFFYQISDRGVELICEDDGVGIAPDAKEHIFERGVGKNTGMGLFLTREILLITGITIKENGIPGRGARFDMLIPNGMWRFVRDREKR
jgi:PAS domain S-box-containing protein